MITSNQARMINLGLLISKYAKLYKEAMSGGAKALYYNQYESYKKEYFELRFDYNRGTLENKYVNYASDEGIDIEQIQIDINEGTKDFIDFCLSCCFEAL